MPFLLRQTRRPVGRVRPGAGDPPRPAPASRLRAPQDPAPGVPASTKTSPQTHPMRLEGPLRIPPGRYGKRHPSRTGSYRQIGGGGGSRTPVRRLFTPGYYVRFRSFGSRPQGPRPAGFPSDHPGLNFALPPPGRGNRAIPLGRRPSAYTGNRRLDVRGYLGRVSVAIVVGDYWFPLFTRSAGPRHATREHRRPRRNRFAPVTRRYHLSPEG